MYYQMQRKKYFPLVLLSWFNLCYTQGGKNNFLQKLVIFVQLHWRCGLEKLIIFLCVLLLHFLGSDGLWSQTSCHSAVNGHCLCCDWGTGVSASLLCTCITASLQRIWRRDTAQMTTVVSCGTGAWIWGSTSLTASSFPRGNPHLNLI